MTGVISTPRSALVHGTTVALGAYGILLRGASGAGKSDLALRFLADEGRFPWPDLKRRLVADDQTIFTFECDRLIASAPATIAGMLEVRGVGIVPVPASAPVALRLVVDLAGASEVDRLPCAQSTEIAGCPIPCRKLFPFELSASVKLALLLAEQVREFEA